MPLQFHGETLLRRSPTRPGARAACRLLLLTGLMMLGWLLCTTEASAADGVALPGMASVVTPPAAHATAVGQLESRVAPARSATVAALTPVPATLRSAPAVAPLVRSAPITLPAVHAVPGVALIPSLVVEADRSVGPRGAPAMTTALATHVLPAANRLSGHGARGAHLAPHGLGLPREPGAPGGNRGPAPVTTAVQASVVEPLPRTWPVALDARNVTIDSACMFWTRGRGVPDVLLSRAARPTTLPD